MISETVVCTVAAAFVVAAVLELVQFPSRQYGEHGICTDEISDSAINP